MFRIAHKIFRKMGFNMFDLFKTNWGNVPNNSDLIKSILFSIFFFLDQDL